MKSILFYIIIVLAMIYSCSKREAHNQMNTIISDYTDSYPIGIKNYDYIVRFYKKNRDTILEISQDRIDIDCPSDFSINFIDSTGHKSINIDYRFIKIGNTKINNKLIFIFDTNDSIGKKLYTNKKIKKEEHKIEKVKNYNYPFFPKKRIYKFKNNHLIFLEETDTVILHNSLIRDWSKREMKSMGKMEVL